MKKSKTEKKQALKNLDELVEVLDADKLREATGGASFVNVLRPREDVGSFVSPFNRLINPADLRGRLVKTDLVSQLSSAAVSRQRF